MCSRTHIYILQDEEETEYAQSPSSTDALVPSNNEHLDSNNPAISEVISIIHMQAVNSILMDIAFFK